MNPELSNLEKFVGTLYPRKFKSKKYLVQMLSAINEFTPSYVLFFSLQYISTTNTVKNSQNNINDVKIMLRIHWPSPCQAVQCKHPRIRKLKKQGIQMKLAPV